MGNITDLLACTNPMKDRTHVYYLPRHLIISWVALVVAIVTRVITAHRVYRTPKSTMPPQTDLGGQLHQRNTRGFSLRL
ncbi:hypothetical protein L226DRAFT_527885 [Lentinus tigrinus ALCF2SS1-7]|uniref:uncharacterized protein n=1 Tax=Lentinus tigrinus ALCF2SS1-7 TaxID=1328758 RepID=UPI001165E59A|nr:hypothetical protein L226DRAFT_527885 [Lentinus tigrinus ALCF2SS1-7]